MCVCKESNLMGEIWNSLVVLLSVKQVSIVREVIACFNGPIFWGQNHLSLKLFVHVKSILTLTWSCFSFADGCSSKNAVIGFSEKKAQWYSFPQKLVRALENSAPINSRRTNCYFGTEGIQMFCKIRPIFKILFPGIFQWLKTVFMFVTGKWRFPMDFSIIAISVIPVSKLLWPAPGVLWFYGYYSP